MTTPNDFHWDRTANAYEGKLDAGEWVDDEYGRSRFLRAKGYIEVFPVDGEFAPGWYYRHVIPGQDPAKAEEPSGPYATSKEAYETAVAW